MRSNVDNSPFHTIVVAREQKSTKKRGQSFVDDVQGSEAKKGPGVTKLPPVKIPSCGEPFG